MTDESSSAAPEAETAAESFIPKGDKPSIVAELFDTYAKVQIGAISKLISIPNFKNMLDRVMSQEGSYVEPMAMPSNVLSFGRNSSHIEMNVYWPGRVWDIQFIPSRGDRPRKYSIPFPNVLIYFSLGLNGEGKFNVNLAKYFCTPKKPGELLPQPGFIKAVDKANKVWPLALPNIFGDCKACYGGNSMPQGFTNDFRALDWYYMFLKESVFNTDLTIPGVSNNYGSPNTYITYLDGKKEYPYNILLGNSE